MDYGVEYEAILLPGKKKKRENHWDLVLGKCSQT